MPEPVRPSLPAGQGDRLSSKEYSRDFGERERATRDRSSWKLERAQHFEEQGSESRDALRRGDWHAVLRLFEKRRDTLRAIALDDERRGSVFHRVRVVEEPVSPYLQWELHSLRQRAEFGERIRVLPAKAVAGSETAGPLPELTIVGEHTLYQVLYTEAGVPDGAVRYTEPGVVSPWVAYVKGLYEAGEDIEPYFERAVAPLPPPPAA